MFTAVSGSAGVFTVQNISNGNWLAVEKAGDVSYAIGSSDRSKQGNWAIAFADGSWE
jgi:hypothetical protein